MARDRRACLERWQVTHRVLAVVHGMLGHTRRERGNGSGVIDLSRGEPVQARLDVIGIRASSLHRCFRALIGVSSPWPMLSATTPLYW
jgi:hypothetical protein